MKKRVLVGLSGGVDSAVTAYLLQKEGFDVAAGFMKNYVSEEENCPTREDRDEAIRVAQFLKIKEFIIFDFREEYNKKVVEYIYEGYKSGITPNPDILCNSEIKFKLFLEYAMKLGFDYIATGHYAQIQKNGDIQNCPPDKGGLKGIKNKKSSSGAEGNGTEGALIYNSTLLSNLNQPNNKDLKKFKNINKGGTNYHLLKGIDPNKDQSYFLSGLDQYQLSKSLFPIGGLNKSEVRKIAEEIGLPNAKRKDSQGICFVGKVDMHKFLEKKIPTKKGQILDTSGNIVGEHNGAWFFTIGQRKGIKVGGGPALFVVHKNVEKNEIFVGNEQDLELFSNNLTLSNWRWVGKEYNFPLDCKAKIRYRQEDQDVRLSTVGKSQITAEFANNQRAIASGQTLAAYVGDELIGSGIIE